MKLWKSGTIRWLLVLAAACLTAACDGGATNSAGTEGGGETKAAATEGGGETLAAETTICRELAFNATLIFEDQTTCTGEGTEYVNIGTEEKTLCFFPCDTQAFTILGGGPECPAQSVFIPHTGPAGEVVQYRGCVPPSRWSLVATPQETDPVGQRQEPPELGNEGETGRGEKSQDTDPQ